MTDDRPAQSGPPEGPPRDSMARFLSDMAHEMRGHLNAVTGFADLLHAEAYGGLNPLQREAVGDIMGAARKLRDLVDAVLDIARLEAGRLVLNWEAVSVRGAVEAALADVGGRARDRFTRLATEVPADLAVWADERRTGQALRALLDNAVKYSPENGTVTVTATAADDGVRVAITDQGPGVAAQKQELIFADFVSLDPSDSPEAGIGLGLALARRLAAAMGGTVTLASSSAAGSTFVLELPRCDPPEGAS